MHDILDLDRRGIPGGFIASEEFVDAAATQAKSLGFEPSMVFIQHPIQDRSDEEMNSLAESAFNDVLALILAQD